MGGASGEGERSETVIELVLVLLILLGWACCLFHVDYMTTMVSSLLPASYSSWPEIIVGLEMNFFSLICKI